jgi:hypothetical protein
MKKAMIRAATVDLEAISEVVKITFIAETTTFKIEAVLGADLRTDLRMDLEADLAADIQPKRSVLCAKNQIVSQLNTQLVNINKYIINSVRCQITLQLHTTRAY